MQELVDRQIGNYQIQRRLARGGMGEIYLGCDTLTNEMVAIKMVHTGATEYCERFRHEVKELAALKHDHILPVLDYGEYDSWCYMVTPYIEYGTLTNRLHQGPLSLEETGEILAQLADALQFAHQQGIVHRDIKPGNVLMEQGRHVYLADFGLVKRMGTTTGLTISGYLIGTPEYMAPELAEEDASPSSDIYALGILLYQMLTGRVPFKDGTPMAVYLKHIYNLPEPPSTLNPNIPVAIERVVLRALEKDPRKRFQSAIDLAQAYQTALAEHCALVDEITQLHVPDLPLPQIRVVKTEPTITPRRNWRILVALSILLLCLVPVVLGAMMSVHAGSSPTLQHTTNKHKITTPTPHTSPTQPVQTPIAGNTQPGTPTPTPTPTPQSSNLSLQNVQNSNTNNNSGGYQNNNNGQDNGNGNSDDNGQGNGQDNGKGHDNDKGHGHGKNK